jgi:hypothetical protein
MLGVLAFFAIVAASLSVAYDLATYEDRAKKWEESRHGTED